ncbi:MAG TPA: hypothetical protein VFZ05_02055 [Nitrososphaera sp.]
MSHEKKGEEDRYSKSMKTVAAGMRVMGVSLVAIIPTYLWFGQIGPSFSTGVQQEQEDALREQYGMEPRERLTSKDLEVPPSLRNATGAGG